MQVDRMPASTSIFVADSCIGGLSVLRSLWGSGYTRNATFLADYQINPLGVKDDALIASVVERWMSMASEHSNTIIMACNTLSVRYELMRRNGVSLPKVEHVISMVDCFRVMVKSESARLANKKILVVSTKYTASQDVYRDILTAEVAGVHVETIAATELERQIARIEPWDGESHEVLSNELRKAIESCDFAVLACTCFPMVESELQALFPNVSFLDPGEYCSEYLQMPNGTGTPELQLRVTGDVVKFSKASEFARSYLPDRVRLS